MRTEKKRERRIRAEGLALVFFLLILLAAVVPSPFSCTKVVTEKCAALTIDTAGKAVMVPCNQRRDKRESAAQEEISQFLFAPMNINTASFEKLMTVRGVGRKLASSICSFREKRKLTSSRDLLLLEGIGPKKARQLETFFIFADEHSDKEL